jgi:hypothetical protein
VVQDWTGISQIAAAASATLMGLLFVAMQLNRERIIKYPALHGRAIETLLIFMLPLLASILIAIPGQTARLLGIELVVLAGFNGLALVAAGNVRKQSGPATPLNRLLQYVTPALLTTILTVISGAILISGQMSGLYWLAAMIVLALTGGVAGAWIFLVRDPDPD